MPGKYEGCSGGNGQQECAIKPQRHMDGGEMLLTRLIPERAEGEDVGGYADGEQAQHLVDRLKVVSIIA